jgi:hypothetical protein
VALFARSRPARKRVNSDDYAELHRELVSQVRAMTHSANDMEATFYRYLEDLIQPWLDTHILARAERDILFDLLIRCRRVEKQLGGRSWLRVIRTGSAIALLGASFFAIILLCIVGPPVQLLTILNGVRGGLDVILARIVHSTDLERLFLIGSVLTAALIYSMSRTAQS